MASKADLWQQGQEMVRSFCTLNGLKVPRFKPSIGATRASCGWYYRGTIAVEMRLCANPGYGGPAWSWPGYIVDRTPYGVWCHELGHYVDDVVGGNKLSSKLRRQTGEVKLTNYCPNAAEWFAEMFRLYCTNPNLLRLLRPETHAALLAVVQPVETRAWQQVLQGAPARTLAMAQRRITETGAGK